MRKSKRIYIPYWEWEDYNNGMWSKVDNEDELLQKAIEFTSNHDLYGKAMQKVYEAWPKTMNYNLSNPNMNRRAFVGHCAVMFELGIPEYITRKAWKELTDKQRILADKEADKVIKSHEYSLKTKSIHKGVGRQMLFEWDTRRSAT